MTGVYIVGIGSTRLGRLPGETVKSLTRAAVAASMADAGLPLSAVEAAWFSNTRQALMEGQNSVRGQIALRAAGLDGIPVVNVENACASSSTGVNQAVAALRAGLHDIALVVGAERMFYPDKSKDEVFKAFLGGTDVGAIPEARALFASMGRGVGPEESEESDAGGHTFFMDMYAAVAKAHMRRYGTTRRQIAAVAAKNHRHSTLNELCQYRFDMTTDEVLADRAVAWPLTRAMCAPISDGAGAVVLCSRRALSRVGANGRAVRIAASILKSGSRRDPVDFGAHVGRRAAMAAYEAAGIDPRDVDLAEVHDATSFGEILQTENLLLCGAGDGGPTAERGETALGGRVPVNPSGGLVSKGHPIAATGIIQLLELVQQLRGEAGPRQVEGARIAVAENGGGFVGVEEAACTVTLLERMAA